MIDCKIVKNFKNFSLDVDFSADGGVWGIMGASGSGKSVILRCIAGILRPDSGVISIDKNTLFDSAKRINLRPQKRRTGYMFQDFALFPNMTVLQNLSCAGNAENAKNLAETFHVSAHLQKYPHQLSGGEKQRAALARILAGSPDILMLDEPFSALDSHLRWELESELAQAFRRFGKTVLYVSHNRDEVFRLCDGIIVLNGGKIDVSGEKHAVFQNPKTVAAARLTGCKNIFPREGGGFLGIRANHIAHAVFAKDGDIVFDFEIISEIEDMFSSILTVRGGGFESVRWEMPKKEREKLRTLPQKLAFPRDCLLFLE